MLRVTADELTAMAALPHGADPFGDEVAIVVDGPAPDVDLGALPAVVIGVDVEGDADRLAAAVEAHPEAAVALAVLLRQGADLVSESATYALLQGGADHRRWLAATARREPHPDPEPVLARRDGDALHVTLHRPAVHNAYSAAMRDALVEALWPVALDPSVRVVLDGAGPSFCSGGDLAEFGTVADPAVAHVLRLRRSAGRALAAIADRVTARVHGTCVGAGVELAAFAGRVVARPDTTFRLPEVAMGLIPGAGGTVSLPRRIGARRTLLLALLDEAIDAPTALAWGLVDAIED